MPMIKIRVAVLAALAMTSACSLETRGPSDPPRLAIVNAAPHSVQMHLHVSSNQSLTSVPLAPRTAESLCPFVLKGTYNFDFVQHDTLYATTIGTLISDASYMAILVDAFVNGDTVYRTLVAGDDAVAPAGSNGIRILNGTSSAGDIYVTAPDEAPSAANRVMANVAPAATATSVNLAFHMRPETATRVRLFDVGTTTNPRSDITLFNTDERRLTTVIFLPRTTATDQGGIQVNACN